MDLPTIQYQHYNYTTWSHIVVHDKVVNPHVILFDWTSATTRSPHYYKIETLWSLININSLLLTLTCRKNLALKWVLKHKSSASLIVPITTSILLRESVAESSIHATRTSGWVFQHNPDQASSIHPLQTQGRLKFCCCLCPKSCRSQFLIMLSLPTYTGCWRKTSSVLKFPLYLPTSVTYFSLLVSAHLTSSSLLYWVYLPLASLGSNYHKLYRSSPAPIQQP